jgi:hypothetical protein
MLEAIISQGSKIFPFRLNLSFAKDIANKNLMRVSSAHCFFFERGQTFGHRGGEGAELDLPPTVGLGYPYERDIRWRLRRT